jgi:hypothetical protein
MKVIFLSHADEGVTEMFRAVIYRRNDGMD